MEIGLLITTVGIGGTSMKRTGLAAITLLFLLAGTFAFAQHEGAKNNSCGYCGMDRDKYAHSAVLIEYEDGSIVGTCSLHCAAIDLALNIDKTPGKLLVGDYLSKKPIDAAAACWTIGGDVPGVMTKRAKWAFESKEECEKYAREHQAKVADLDESMKAAYEDMYADTKMIREKRKARKSQQAQPGQQQPK